MFFALLFFIDLPSIISPTTVPFTSLPPLYSLTDEVAFLLSAFPTTPAPNTITANTAIIIDTVFHKWIQADDTEKCVYVYERIYGDEKIVIFLNTYCDNYENYSVKFDDSVITSVETTVNFIPCLA